MAVLERKWNTELVYIFSADVFHLFIRLIYTYEFCHFNRFLERKRKICHGKKTKKFVQHLHINIIAYRTYICINVFNSILHPLRFSLFILNNLITFQLSLYVEIIWGNTKYFWWYILYTYVICTYIRKYCFCYIYIY